MKNSIVQLKTYIEENLKEKRHGDYWEFDIYPEIKDAISELNEKESEIFSTEIFTWEEALLYRLADGIIFSGNTYIDPDYLYCKIFLKVKDKERLNYLVENLYGCFKKLDKKTKPLSFFLEMKDKLKKEYNTIREEDDFFMQELNETIRQRKS